MSNSQFTQSALQNPLYRNTQVGPCRVVAATNQTGTYYNGDTNNGVGAQFTYTSAAALVIDSVTLVLNDYVLLAGQTSAYENGIYQVINPGSASAGAVLQRRADYQTIEQIRTGFYIPVYAGTVYAGSYWMLVEPTPAGIGVAVVSGANNLTFAAAPSAGVGTFLVDANNLSDLTNAATAVTNLGFTQTAAVISNSVTQMGSSSQVSVTLTPAQVIAAFATPQVLIPAAAGKVAIVKSASVYTASTGNTAFATGTAPIIQYGTTIHGAGTSAVGAGLVTGDIEAAASQVRSLGPTASTAWTGISNTAVTFSCATAYTAGTGTNITFVLDYDLITATV
jgi:hypothetical protein